jgi:hypothetical protein
MAIVIPADGSPRRKVTPATAGTFALEELQALVGGYIETLRAPDGRGLLLMNEDGKRRGLPVNERATMAMRGYLRPGDVIVGDVVLVTAAEMGEDD